MSTCSHCGAEIPAGVKYCIGCGAPAEIRPVQQPIPAPQAPAGAAVLQDDTPPLTTGGFFWSMLLMSLPVIGIIFTIVWACGGCKNLNRRNLSRAMLIWWAIAIVLLIVLGVIGYMAYGPQIAEFSQFTEFASDSATWQMP